MPRLPAALSRRPVLRAAAATAAASALPARATCHGASTMILTLAGLHSPYARMASIGKEIRRVKEESGGLPVALVINGDMSERGNVVATRSGAAPDWLFLATLAAELPTYINVGNHETAPLDDPASFVARAACAGCRVIWNLIDRRSGRFLAPVSDRIGPGGIDVAMLGVATTNPFVYCPPAREVLTFLDTECFVASAFEPATSGVDHSFLVTNARVTPDKALLPLLPEGALVLGAHDHLDFQTETGGKTYLHGASWDARLGVVRLAETGAGIGVRDARNRPATHRGRAFGSHRSRQGRAPDRARIQCVYPL